MVQNANTRYLDLSKWFNDKIDEFTSFEKKNILRLTKGVLEDKAYNIEKDIFKYVAKYLMNRVDPPSTVDGLPYESPKWIPLKDSYAKRKGKYLGLGRATQRKWVYSGSLRNYLLGLTASYWYGKPRAKIDYKNDYIIYESMFLRGRKPFRAKGQENKIDYSEPLRPIITPMEDFLFNTKLNVEIDNWIDRYLEDNYG